MELEKFRNQVCVSVRQAEEKLSSAWYIQNVLPLFSGENKIVKHISPDNTEAFFESVHTLIGNQIRSIHECSTLYIVLIYVRACAY